MINENMSSGFVFKTMYKITPSGCNEVDQSSVASKLVASISVLMAFSCHRASKWYPSKKLKTYLWVRSRIQ